MSSNENVRFVRIRGRVVPIRGNGGERKPQPKTSKVMIGVATRDIGVGERFKIGFSAFGKWGAAFGGLGGLGAAAFGKGALGKVGMAAAGATAGAVGGGLQWGLLGGAANALVGNRKQTRLIIVKKGK